jgi:micrococcal nuclease
MNTQYRNETWLTERYCVDGWSRTQIAEYCGVTVDTISSWMTRFGIELEVRPPSVELPNYSYRIDVVNVVDGDTLDADIDVGFGITVRKRLRLFGVNAWEPRGPTREQGRAATNRVKDIIDQGSKIYAQTRMDDLGKYGRVLAWIWVEVDGNLLSLNKVIVLEGHGIPT